MLKNSITLLFIVLTLGSQAQKVGLSISRGPVLEIYPDFPSSSGATRLGLSYFTHNDSSNLSDRAHNHPYTGLKLSYFDLGNSILGNAIGIQYQFLKHRQLAERLQFLYGVNLGMVFFTNPYDYADNPTNIAIGSYWSFLPELIVGFNYKISDHFSATPTFNMYHTSNGHAKLPNVGINVPSYQLSLNYHFNQPEQYSTEIKMTEWQKKWFFNARFSIGINEYGRSTAPTNGPKNEIFLVSFYASRRYSPKGFFQMGMDTYYNSGYRNFIISQDIDEQSDLEDSFIDASALLIFIGHEYVYRHFGMLVQAGYNLHNPYLKYYIEEDKSSQTSKTKGEVPGKFGVKYYLKDPVINNGPNMTFGVFIKSNMTQADFLEFGVGFRI